MSVDAVALPVEYLLPPPDQQDRMRAITVLRAVGSFQRAFVAKEVTLDFEAEDPSALIAQAEEAAIERMDRIVLATAQHSRVAPVPERTAYLARSYMPSDSQDVTGPSPYGPPVPPREGGLKYSFGYSADGKVLGIVQTEVDKKEAAAHALIVQESHRLAEERGFTPQEELIVLLALERMAAKGRTEWDRKEAEGLIEHMFGSRVEELHAAHA